MLPSGPLTPTLPFLPGFQQKCLAAILSTYGKTAIWLTLTGLKVPTTMMIRVNAVIVHFGFVLNIISNAALFCFSGCMFDKVARHFYDDTCVVPEKVEGESSLELKTAPCVFVLEQRTVMVRYVSSR